MLTTGWKQQQMKQWSETSEKALTWQLWMAEIRWSSVWWRRRWYRLIGRVTTTACWRTWRRLLLLPLLLCLQSCWVMQYVHNSSYVSVLVEYDKTDLSVLAIHNSHSAIINYLQQSRCGRSLQYQARWHPCVDRQNSSVDRQLNSIHCLLA